MSANGLDAETLDLLRLHLLPGLGPRLTKAILERFGSAGNVLRATVQDLQSLPHLRQDVAEQITQAMRRVDIDAELTLLEKHSTSLVRLGTPGYASSLATIHDPPQLLYVRGSILPSDAKAVALVGSRHCTAYGRKVTERLAAGLARAGYTVVSGLARGIDGVAHRAALDAGGRTLAVLAGGLARIYPPEHADLATEITAAGALLSEAPMGLSPLPQMFPQRNRLISGLSRGIVVVEAAEKSGALLTASHAAEQGREVLAVPGPVDNPASAGTNRLLKDGAILVRHAEDILEALEGSSAREQLLTASPGGGAQAPRQPRTAVLPANLPENQREILEFLVEGTPHADEVVQRSGRSAAEVTGALLMLEMLGLVRRLPGNRFERRF